MLERRKHETKLYFGSRAALRKLKYVLRIPDFQPTAFFDDLSQSKLEHSSVCYLEARAAIFG